MIRPIATDVLFLARKAEPACAADASIADDLLDTLKAHKDDCVGMAANMIGEPKSIIVFDDDGTLREMFNPVILSGKGPYPAQEGCLSLTGQRPARRFRQIKVQWQDRAMKPHIKTFTGWTAQIIQHEIDHCAGIII